MLSWSATQALVTVFRGWARTGRNEAASGEESASERVVGGCFVACVYACGTHSSWSTALCRNMIQTKAALANSLTLIVVVAWRATRAVARTMPFLTALVASERLLAHLNGGECSRRAHNSRACCLVATAECLARAHGLVTPASLPYCHGGMPCSGCTGLMALACPWYPTISSFLVVYA